ncbi:GD21652 [Drosophila simulans]|uniref:GD21652 n=1 Tax=Drosophila simulans TaxID=7240 RepID=B4Q3Z0_DROSI|nr:GD21652 [Drosophila simulans]
MENLAKIRMSQKLACWQQILTTLGTSSMSEQEWNTFFRGFLESWQNPYCIQTSCDPSIPLRQELLVRPRKAVQENPHGPLATPPESPVFLEPINSTAPREHLSPSKSLDFSVNSTGDGERSPSVSNKNSTHKNPGDSKYTEIWKQSNIHTTSSSSKAQISMRRDSKLSSTKKRPVTCPLVDDTTDDSRKNREPHASASKKNVFKSGEASPNAPNLKDSCAFPDVLMLSPNCPSKITERGNSFGQTQDYKTSPGKIIKRVPRYSSQFLKPKTGKVHNLGDKSKNKQQPKTPPPFLLDNEYKESSDDSDDQLPLSKLSLKMKRNNKDCSPAPEKVKLKGGRPAQNKKEQLPWEPSILTNLTDQGKRLAEPLRKSVKKPTKQKKRRLRAPPQSKTQEKQSTHEMISEQAKTISKASGQQTSRVHRSLSPSNIRNNSLKLISAKMLMPAHNPQDYATNNMHVGQPLGDASEIDRCLENLNNKSPSEIDTQLVNTSKFLEKVARPSTVEVDKSDLMDIFMGGNEELDYEYDDDDVLSVAASWNGLDDENVPEVEPRKVAKTAEQLPKTEPSTETLKPIKKENAQKKQNIKSFQIPKLNAKNLKTQPSVMRSLYEKEELKKIKVLAKPAPPSQGDKPLAEYNRNQRDEATAARRATETFPVFAPPYRIAPESAAALVSANSQQVIPQVHIPTSQEGVNWIKHVFGIRCMHSVDNKCISFNCDHTRNNLGEVQQRLMRMDDDTLVSLYRQTKRSFFLFQTYYTSFVDIFELRHLWQYLLIMLVDCRLYKSISAPLLAHVYEALSKCGMQKEAVKRIMEHVWLPCKAHKYRDLMLTTLNILSNANWEDYCDELTQLDTYYNFKIPHKNLITILKSSEDCSDKFAKAVKLITLHPTSICTNETIMSILSSASNESASAIQGPPGAGSCHSSFIAPAAAVQPPHFTVPNFGHLPTHSFNYSNEYTTNIHHFD